MGLLFVYTSSKDLLFVEILLSKKRSKGAIKSCLEIGSKERAKSGDFWEVIPVNRDIAGSTSKKNVIQVVSGPTTYAKNRIIDSPVRAFRLFIDDFILKHIHKCTETEARSQKKNDWSITFSELEAFNAIVLARGVYGAGLWSWTIYGQKPGHHPFFVKQCHGKGFATYYTICDLILNPPVLK